MTDHLPECPLSGTCENNEEHDPLDMPDWCQVCDHRCICKMLRACEERVEAEWLARYNYDPDLVWEDALDVAQQAVKAICQQNPLIWPTDEAAMQALDAAIDVLKEGGTKEYKVRSTWSAALDAARAAIEAIPADYKIRGEFETYSPYAEGRSDFKDSALAAINALREQS